MTNIEQLKTEVDDIKKSLNELKNNVSLSEVEKKNKAEILKKQAEVTKQKIEKEIELLENATDTESVKKKEEAEALLKSLTDVTNLYNSIIDSSNTNVHVSDQSAIDNRNLFERSWDWIGKQWNEISRENLEKKPVETILRGTGFALTGVGAGVLAYKGVKKLWNWAFGKKKKKEDGENNGTETKPKKKKEKKPFWDRWYGKAIKYSVIGSGVYYVIHGLKTGKWSLSDFLNRESSGPDATSAVEDQVEGAEKLKENDPEKFEKYRELGENIDSQYNQLMEKEISAGWGGMSIADGYAKYCDSSKLSLSDFKATVPMCIDNQFSTVSDMLSEGGYYAYLRSKNFAELKDVFMHMLTDGSQKLIGSIFPFFGCLKSFEKYKDKDFLESVKTWLDDGTPTERCEELQLFFRQYAKVINYVQDKRLAVIEKIAERKFAITGDAGVDNSKYATVEDAIRDSEWFEKNIESDSEYQDFMQGKITHAIDVMKKESIFDDNISGIVKEVKNGVDDLREELLNEKDGKDALIRLKENKEALTEDNYKEGLETADKVYGDIEDYFEKDWTYMYFSSAHTLINSEEKNIQEFIENSGLKAVKDNLKTKLLEYKTKFNNKTITSDEVDEYNDLINSYFAMKKEVMVASSTIQMMKSNDASRVDRALNVGAAILTDFFNQTKKSWKELRDGNYGDARLYGTFPMIAAGFALRKYGNPPKVFTISDGRKIYGVNKRLFAKQAKFLGDMLLKLNPIGIAPASIEGAYKLTGNVFRRTSHIYGLNAEFLRRTRYNIEHGDELLFQDVLEGRIGGIKAENIARKGCKKWKVCTTSQRSLESFIQTMSGEKISLTEKQISDLFKTKVSIGGKEFDISFMRNETIRNKILVQTGNEGWWVKPINGYYRRYYDYSKIGDNAKTLGFGELFGWSNGGVSKISNLSENQLNFLRKIVEDGDFTNPEKQLKSLFENIDKIDLADVSEENLIKIIEELGSNPTDLEDLAKIQNKVNKFKIINIPPERLRQPIFGEIDNVKRELEDSMKSERNAAKKTQIQQQINQLEDFKRKLGTMPDDEFKRIDGLIECFKGTGTRKTLNEVITEVTKLKKIMDTNGGSLKIGEGIGSSGDQLRHIDQIIKDLDAESLRKAKKYYPGMETELEDIAKIFEQIKLKNTSKVLGSADDILKGIKILVKFLKAA